MTDIPLHPRLRPLGARQRQLMLLLSMLLFLTIFGGMIAVMAIVFSNGDLFDLLLFGVLGLVMLPMVAALSGLQRYLDRWLSQQLDRASQLLRDSPPITARLAPTGLALRTGVLATLEVPGAEPGRDGPWHVLLNPSFRWSPPPRREVAVQVYCAGFAPGADLVALQPDGAPLLGKVVALDAFQRRMRLTRIALIILLALLLAILGVLANRI
ncbi:MAG: hypothetical protein RKR03_12920 [Candidatus Competibacter sp.]|nr:hypothetical protein [Candidatus Competibacter sp.]